MVLPYYVVRVVKFHRDIMSGPLHDVQKSEESICRFLFVIFALAVKGQFFSKLAHILL